ncbi:Protein sco1 [Porphyridium purpureum]|uniref:Protein sco1 n=1 Tax=Porphyridium purpureum TaxID=35688 RepID=A0A5J4YU36_PORPP|nr:Protein sco1 [Porphyridium purpureum]|eukprot:POR6905..scf227_4
MERLRKVTASIRRLAGTKPPLSADQRRSLRRRSFCTSQQQQQNPPPNSASPPPRTPSKRDAGTTAPTLWNRFRAGMVDWKTLGVISALGCGVLGYYSYQKQRKLEQLRESQTKTVSGKAKIGGPFTLVDTDGNKVSDTDFRNKFMLIYFGFTFCPDICPDELDKISAAIECLGSLKEFVQPVFISIDPERDTPERIKEYLKDFHPKFVGLTGSLEECTAVAKKFRVYFSKDQTLGDDYLVDHSIISYIVDPTGEFLEFYGKNVSASDMSLRLGNLIRDYKRQLKAAGQG